MIPAAVSGLLGWVTGAASAVFVWAVFFRTRREPVKTPEPEGDTR